MAEAFEREEFVAGYRGEADEHVRSVESCLLRLESAQGAPQPKLVRELFRSLHTLKGLSAMVGVEPIVAISHEMESILRVADRAASGLSGDAVELLLSGIKAIDQRLKSFGKRESVAPAPPALIAALKRLAAQQVPSGGAESSTLSLASELLSKLTRSEREQLVQGIRGGQRGVRVDFLPGPAKSERGMSITSVRERVAKLAEIVKVLPSAVPKSAEAPGGLQFSLIVLTSAEDLALAEAADVEPGTLSPILLEEIRAEQDTHDDLEQETVSSSATIRVDVKRLDDAFESLSALVVGRFRFARALATLREQGSDVRELTQLLSEHTRELRSLRATLTRARMVSVAQLLERVPLLVRGMSKSSRKRVRLSIDAGRAELDKGVAERIFPAILHLVRNAVDHAIEAPDERVRLGKPREGEIAIHCFERSDNQLELTVRDDGAGIDRERVARMAGRAVPQDDQGLLALITQPGLSTQEVANNRSGRGMGMDIVRRTTVDTLGGELSVESGRNRGTCFTLRIPLSISILDVLSLRCAEQTFVVPQSVVEEIVELNAAQVVAAPAPVKRGAPISMLRQRGQEIPLVSLSALFELEVAAAATGSCSRAEPRASAAIVVRRGTERFAFAVDKMLTQQEVVIRPLEDPLVKVHGVTGTTDLGDGLPTLVLDLLSLATRAGAFQAFPARFGQGAGR
jgi:two-component system, chemotaxis family, sensor kinase CheA